MKIYNNALIKDKTIILDGQEYEFVMGKHCIWIPTIETKLVLSFHGGIDPNGFHKNEKRIQIDFNFNRENYGWNNDSLESIGVEKSILQMLWVDNMAPKPGETVFIKNVISKFFTSEYHCDSQGWYGFQLEDANKLKPGQYSFDKFNSLYLKSGLINASAGAIGDLEKKEGNLINGYLIDVRRSLFDMMSVNETVPYNHYFDDQEQLKAKIRKYGQFPFMERSQNYQSYYLSGEWILGTRDIAHRYSIMGLPEDFKGQSVIDLGCQIGSMAFEAYRKGATKITGLEYQPEFIDCARDLARANGFYVNFMEMDLTKTNEVAKYLNNYYSEGVDIVFALSIVKHIGCELNFQLLNKINWKMCYIESHNIGKDGSGGYSQEILKYLNSLRWKHEQIGITNDRSPRIIWRVTK
jgi:2-polyprenyl-3-methyl-5-hydroxy-6-metoxy-1,4-benzoquinol methylase